VCYEVGDRSIFVSRLASADFRSVASFVPPFPALGASRYVARLNLARDETLGSTEKGQDDEKIEVSFRTGRMGRFLSTLRVSMLVV